MIATICTLNEEAVIVLSALFKFPTDGELIKQAIKVRNRMLEEKASRTNKLEYFNGNLALNIDLADRW